MAEPHQPDVRPLTPEGFEEFFRSSFRVLVKTAMITGRRQRRQRTRPPRPSPRCSEPGRYAHIRSHTRTGPWSVTSSSRTRHAGTGAWLCASSTGPGFPRKPGESGRWHRGESCATGGRVASSEGTVEAPSDRVREVFSTLSMRARAFRTSLDP